MEPIAIIDREYVLKMSPETTEAKQAIIDCGNGLGLSMIWARGGDRWSHGTYCGDNTYEVCIIRFLNDEKTDYDLCYGETKHDDVMGWLTIEDVGALAERIGQEGLEGYRRD